MWRLSSRSLKTKVSSVQFFIDFDGTITKTDVVDKILEKFASDEWKEIEKEWIEGTIGSRECLTRQLALVSATKTEISQLISEVEIDPHFVSFLKLADQYGVSVTIVSDGFRLIIEGVLKHALKNTGDLYKFISIYANDLVWKDEHLNVAFPDGAVCQHGCANCKPRVILKRQTKGKKVIFIGDGLSDRFAAMVSDLTFAKSKLLKFCEQKNIKHKKYSNFKEIEEWMIKYFADQHSARDQEKPYLVERN